MVNKSPLVSIGFPVYNGAEYLVKSIESILKQTYKNFELIISNNNSTDNTETIIQKYRKKDCRIKYFRQKTNIGGLRNYNFVLNSAKGQYFLWAAADDLWDKNFVKSLIQPMLVNKNIVMSTSDYLLFSNKYQKEYRLNLPEISSSYQCLYYFLNHPYFISVFMYSLFRIKCVRKYGIHVDKRPIFENSSDMLTIIRIILQGSVAHSPEILFYKQDSGHYLDAIEVLKKHDISLEFFNKVKRFLLFPFMFSFDAYYSIKYTSESDLIIKQKLLLFVQIIKKMILQFIQYFWLILKGSLTYLINFI
jgi:glycosyltransferase involved in cell wall biosynthesis